MLHIGQNLYAFSIRGDFCQSEQYCRCAMPDEGDRIDAWFPGRTRQSWQYFDRLYAHRVDPDIINPPPDREGSCRFRSERDHEICPETHWMLAYTRRTRVDRMNRDEDSVEVLENQALYSEKSYQCIERLCWCTPTGREFEKYPPDSKWELHKYRMIEDESRYWEARDISHDMRFDRNECLRRDGDSICERCPQGFRLSGTQCLPNTCVKSAGCLFNLVRGDPRCLIDGAELCVPPPPQSIPTESDLSGQVPQPAERFFSDNSGIEFIREGPLNGFITNRDGDVEYHPDADNVACEDHYTLRYTPWSTSQIEDARRLSRSTWAASNQYSDKLYLDYGDDFFTQRGKCDINQCTCHNGVAHTGTHRWCTRQRLHSPFDLDRDVCVACNPGYVLDQMLYYCFQATCVCPHGTPSYPIGIYVNTATDRAYASQLLARHWHEDKPENEPGGAEGICGRVALRRKVDPDTHAVMENVARIVPRYRKVSRLLDDRYFWPVRWLTHLYVDNSTQQSGFPDRYRARYEKVGSESEFDILQRERKSGVSYEMHLEEHDPNGAHTIDALNRERTEDTLENLDLEFGNNFYNIRSGNSRNVMAMQGRSS